MSEGFDVLLRHVDEIAPVATSHGVGIKRVIATQDQVGKLVTQIARTLLLKGEEVEEHVHPTMDEHFFFLEGECHVAVAGKCHLCEAGDYLFIPASNEHSIKVISNTVMITIGIEQCSKNISE